MSKEIIILGKLNIIPLIKAQKTFERGLDAAKSELEIAGAIQMFEVTYELIWKTLKRILSVRGVAVNSPKETFRMAAKEKFEESDLPFIVDLVEYYLVSDSFKKVIDENRVPLEEFLKS